mmetsp:Transcript_39761/g.91969  ORF Transcript_39761/g.91969 Transcript_39761/m.91969 type:complete len:239 (+) Transcript_39761:342-1058(+)
MRETDCCGCWTLLHANGVLAAVQQLAGLLGHLFTPRGPALQSWAGGHCQVMRPNCGRQSERIGRPTNAGACAYQAPWRHGNAGEAGEPDEAARGAGCLAPSNEDPVCPRHSAPRAAIPHALLCALPPAASPSTRNYVHRVEPHPHWKPSRIAGQSRRSRIRSCSRGLHIRLRVGQPSRSHPATDAIRHGRLLCQPRSPTDPPSVLAALTRNSSQPWRFLKVLATHEGFGAAYFLHRTL